MQDPALNQNLQGLSTTIARYSHLTLAKEIVSLAIELSESKEQNKIIEKMDLATKLIIAAKRHITKEMFTT
jgi:hypothetical protein